MLLQKVNNHPVHILNDKGNFSPSSFIPFCHFGGKFIGAKINDYEIPVCNIFKPRMNLDQRCYETDLQELKDSNSERLENQLEMGLTLVLDYNEERQINYNIISKDAKKKSLYHHDKSVAIYLDTISKEFTKMISIRHSFKFRSCEAFGRRSIQSSQCKRNKSYIFFFGT